MALLPWLYLQITKETNKNKVGEILGDLAAVVGRFSKTLQKTFLGFQEKKAVSAPEFLTQVCTALSTAYFPVYAKHCAEALTVLLQSEFKQYHPIVLQITDKLLSQRNAIVYVKAFDEIISIAHGAVTRTGVGTQNPPPAMGRESSRDTPIVDTTPLDMKTVGVTGPRESVVEMPLDGEMPAVSSEAAYHFEMAARAADVIATVIALFSREQELKEQRYNELTAADMVKPTRGKKKGHSRTITTAISGNTQQVVNMNARAMPVRSLRNAIDALRQVVQCSPMFPKEGH